MPVGPTAKMAVLPLAAARSVEIRRSISRATVDFRVSTEFVKIPAAGAVRLTLPALIITWRQEMTKEPAGDEKNDTSCSTQR